jgi:hypothetical protein
MLCCALPLLLEDRILVFILELILDAEIESFVIRYAGLVNSICTESQVRE